MFAMKNRGTFYMCLIELVIGVFYGVVVSLPGSWFGMFFSN